MSEQVMDAKQPETTSPLEKAFEAASDEPKQPQVENKQEVKEEAKTPNTSAETQNTESGQGEDNPPWHKDPRWKKWQDERKNLETYKKDAEVASTFKKAFDEHPELAKMVMNYVQKTMSGEGVNGPETDDRIEEVASKLLETKAFKSLFGKYNEELGTLKNVSMSAAEKAYNHEFQNVAGKYKSYFNDIMKDFDIVDAYKSDFEKTVWNEMAEIAPEALTELRFDPASFEQAVKAAKGRYEALTNSITSKFTSKLSNDPVPKGGAGHATINTGKSEEEEMNDFVSQLRSLKN